MEHLTPLHSCSIICMSFVRRSEIHRSAVCVHVYPTRADPRMKNCYNWSRISVRSWVFNQICDHRLRVSHHQCFWFNVRPTHQKSQLLLSPASIKLLNWPKRSLKMYSNQRNTGVQTYPKPEIRIDFGYSVNYQESVYLQKNNELFESLDSLLKRDVNRCVENFL